MKQFFEDLSANRADVNVGIFLAIFGFLLVILQSVVKKNMTTITAKFSEVGTMPFRNVIKYSLFYIIPIGCIIYIIYDNYNKPYDFKTNLSLIVIFASLVVVFLLDFISPLYKMIIKILDKNSETFGVIDENNKLFSDEIIKLQNEVEELKKRLS